MSSGSYNQFNIFSFLSENYYDDDVDDADDDDRLDLPRSLAIN